MLINRYAYRHLPHSTLQQVLAVVLVGDHSARYTHLVHLMDADEDVHRVARQADLRLRWWGFSVTGNDAEHCLIITPNI